jgi:hypothetical protein
MFEKNIIMRRTYDSKLRVIIKGAGGTSVGSLVGCCSVNHGQVVGADDGVLGGVPENIFIERDSVKRRCSVSSLKLRNNL